MGKPNKLEGRSPLVSILICNYNYGQFLREAVDSALNQTYGPMEIVVVDDGSTDNSREIIQGYGKEIIPVMKRNGGQTSAVNAGFAACHGKLVCLLDSDDVFLPEKVSRVVEAWKQRPNSCIVYHQVQITDARKNNLGKPWPRSVVCGDIRGKVERAGGWWPHPITSGLSFPRFYMERLLPMPSNLNRLLPDTYLAAPGAFAGPVTGIAESLSLVRRHGRNAWNANGANGRGEGRQQKVQVAIRRAEQYQVEFQTLENTLRTRLNIPAAISLDDMWEYQRYRRDAGEPVSLPQVLWNLVKCPTLPFPMKWREAVKLVLDR